MIYLAFRKGAVKEEGYIYRNDTDLVSQHDVWLGSSSGRSCFYSHSVYPHLFLILDLLVIADYYCFD